MSCGRRCGRPWGVTIRWRARQALTLALVEREHASSPAGEAQLSISKLVALHCIDSHGEVVQFQERILGAPVSPFQKLVCGIRDSELPRSLAHDLVHFPGPAVAAFLAAYPCPEELDQPYDRRPLDFGLSRCHTTSTTSVRVATVNRMGLPLWIRPTSVSGGAERVDPLADTSASHLGSWQKKQHPLLW